MTQLDSTQSRVSVEDQIYALQQRNLVYNSDFRYFSNANIENLNITQYEIPDGWVLQNPSENGSAYFDDVNKEFVIMTGIGNDLITFSQALHEFPRWKKYLCNKVVTAKVTLKLDVNGTATVTLTDGITSNSITRSGIGDYEIVVQTAVSENAQLLNIQISSDLAGTQINISNVCANVGLVALENLPCIVEGIIGERKQYIATENPPAEELSLCTSPVELDENYSRLNSVLNGRFGRGSNDRSMLLNMGGYFSRAWDNTAQVDPDADDRTAPGTGIISGNNVSTVQQDSFLRHSHGLDFTVSNLSIIGGDIPPNSSQVTKTSSETNPEPVSQDEGKETRSKNIYELYTIKWS
jgi:hypothetical protein